MYMITNAFQCCHGNCLDEMEGLSYRSRMVAQPCIATVAKHNACRLCFALRLVNRRSIEYVLAASKLIGKHMT